MTRQEWLDTLGPVTLCYKGMSTANQANCDVLSQSDTRFMKM